MEKVEVLNDGFVKLIDTMGSDQRVLEAARVSTGSVSKGEVADRKLIRYLMFHEHHTPFEKIVSEFHVRCPLFVARQWQRHRVGSFSEVSARYREMETEYFMPPAIGWRTQGKKNKQGSDTIFSDVDEISRNESVTQLSYDYASLAYENLLGRGVTREQARTVLPVGTYTEFFWTVNFRSLMNFLNLRMDEHAQEEIRVYANGIYRTLSKLPFLRNTVAAYADYRRVTGLFREALNKYKSTDALEDYLRKFVSVEPTGH